ncbi:hypothetical protein ZWY2020_022135 [Hordeum vulgare]|nr:hypothetical protein ZWY2020_022135 [Hordeum vulgare]
MAVPDLPSLRPWRDPRQRPVRRRRRPLVVGGLGWPRRAMASTTSSPHVSASHGRPRAGAGRPRQSSGALLPLDAEIRAAPWFLAAMLLMFAALLCEAISVRFVSSVLGLRWHRSLFYSWSLRCILVGAPDLVDAYVG